MAHPFLGKFGKRIGRIPVLKHLQWGIEAAVLGAFWKICAWVPPDRATAFGQKLFGMMGPRSHKSRYMRRNLDLAFPNLSEAGKASLLRSIWANTGAVFAEYPHLKTICQSEYDTRFEIQPPRFLETYQSGRKQGIFVSAHIANWEIGAAPATHYDVDLSVVYAPISNPMIDRMLRQRRTGLGCKLISRGNTLPVLKQALKDGESLGIVADHRDDTGVPLPFFGHDKLTTIIPARLALQFDCDLVPTRVERLEGARFRVTFHEPIRPDPNLSSKKDQATQMMGEVNKLFEEWICAQPQQWLCTKRAWAKHLSPGTVAPEKSS
jgi:KDO2-lipid IV(A) lauroyltransferase